MISRRPVSIRTVAALAGVSTATVSNVLSGKASVTELLASRVRAAVDELGYVADGSASRLRSGKQALAGVVVPDLANPFFAAFVSALEHMAREDGFDLLVVSCNNETAQEAERLDKIRSWRPAGLIVLPCDGALAQRMPSVMHAPVVAVDRLPDQDGFDVIAVDNVGGAEAMTRHCAAQGFSSCLVLCATLQISNVRERLEGVRLAHGAMTMDVLECGLLPDTALPAIRERLSNSPWPDVIISLDHSTTLSAYEVLLERGVSIGTDVALASFDETEWMRLVSPAVTTVRQPVRAMAQAAWSRLTKRMTGDASPPVSLRLQCILQIRGSTLRGEDPSRKAAV